MPTAFYLCDKCHRKFDHEKAAVECEATHFTAATIFEPLEYVLGPYPFRIRLTFPDGIKKTYTKDDY